MTTLLLASNNVAWAILKVVTGLILSFYLVGASMESALKEYFRFSEGTLIGDVSLSILLSFSYFMCISITLSWQYSLSDVNLALAVIGAIAVSDIVQLIPHNLRNSPTANTGMDFKSAWPIFLILLFGLSLGLLFRSSFKWPSMPGWDEYTYLGGSNWIFDNHGTTNIMPTAPGSSIPTSYLFQVFVASIATLIGADPYAVFWAGPFLTIPVYGLSVYGISRFFAPKKYQAFFAALVALAISGGESFLGPQYFFPSTLSVILFLLILNTVLGFEKEGNLQMILVWTFVFLSYAIYYFPFIVTFPIILIFLLKKRTLGTWLRAHLTLISIMIFVTMIGASWLGASLLSPDILPAGAKLGMINNVYPPLLWFMISIGGIIAIGKYVLKHPRNQDILLMLIYTSSLLIIFFLPPISSIRTEMFFRGFSAIVASFLFAWIPEGFGFVKRKLLPHSRLKLHFDKPRILSYVVSGLLLVLIVQPFVSYSQNVSYWSNISKDEYLAAYWISKNSASDSYILTDPSTGYVLRGLTTRNSSTSFLINGHTPSTVGMEDLSHSILDFFKEEDVSKISDYYDRFPRKPDLIVITTRTMSWVLQNGIDRSFCAPTGKELTQFPGMEKFSSPLFTLLKNWTTVEIYRPTNAKVASVWPDDSFSKGQPSWYLDGAYGDHSSSTLDSVMNITVEASGNSSAWMGPTQQLPNVSGATFIKLRYKTSIPCYSLELVLWRSEGYWIIHSLRQSNDWSEQFFPLTSQEAAKLTKIGIIMWTSDTETHSALLDYIFFGTIASPIASP